MAGSERGILDHLRVASLLAAAVIVALVTVAFALVSFGDYVHKPGQAVLRGYAELLVRELPSDPDQGTLDAFARAKAVEVVIRRGGKTLVAYPDDGPRLPSAGFRTIGVEVALADGGVAVLSWPSFDPDRAHSVFLVVLVALIVAVLFARHAYEARLLQPLRWLRQGVESVGEGDIDVVLPIVNERDELGHLARAFNAMARRVRTMLEERERLLADVSHELRSPLTRMKVALELLPDGEKRRALADSVQTMERLVTTLLERERLNRPNRRSERVPVDLAALASETAATETRPPGVSWAAPDDGAYVLADPAMLRILIGNLIDNAIRFSLPDSRPVVVSVEPDVDGWRLIVADDGVGISPADSERVFKPFVKLDPSRGHGTGYGLGLDLCRRIVEAHEGSIALEPGAGRGCRFVVRLPVSMN